MIGTIDSVGKLVNSTSPQPNIDALADLLLQSLIDDFSKFVIC